MLNYKYIFKIIVNINATYFYQFEISMVAPCDARHDIIF